MLNLPPWRGRKFARLRDLRQEMIDQTGAWLTWALRQDGQLPRIPRRRVDQGGYTELLKRREHRALANHWWRRTLGVLWKEQ